MSKKIQQKRYACEFKQMVVETMRKKKLSYCETARQYNISDKIAATWERIYLEEGMEGLSVERRGRANSAGGVRKWRPPNLDKKVLKEERRDKRRE